MTPAAHEAGWILEVRGLSKAFPGVQALRDAQLAVRRGEIHAVLGENGAGKSTLMNILIGLQTADAGQIRFGGRPVRFRHPHEALRSGLAMIHQELMPFPELTVAENIHIGHEPASRWLGWVDRKAMNRTAARLLERLGLPLAPTRPMRELSVAEMQTVEIARALAHEAALIIMDEPTSAISAREAEALFGIMEDLRARGVAMLYISHKLDEVFRLADTVTVLRDGRWVGTRPRRGLDRATLVAWMVGRVLAAPDTPAARSPGPVALAVRGLSRRGCFRGVSFELRRCEVLGLAGLMGAGRTPLGRALFGLAPADAGEIRVHGRPARIGCPRDALALGIGWVGEDRRRDGLVPTMSVGHNVTLASLRRCCTGPWICRRRERALAAESLRGVGVRGARAGQRVTGLSGGNQQKVVLAKTLLNGPDILILDEPTRGIDVGAKAELHALISGLAGAGKAVLLISSELPELLALSDRILVMREGVFTAEVDARSATQEEILRWAMAGGAGPGLVGGGARL
ncbi:MAG: sugar ABC transporter ATP-binding protein [Verrucomicrobia bacterium]|nr:sugar ABC transporter ATP-binding protein [Verrucomicrobiota bacterium]